jgi:hypothetical protein
VIADLVLVLLLGVANNVGDEGKQHMLKQCRSHLEECPIMAELKDVEHITCTPTSDSYLIYHAQSQTVYIGLALKISVVEDLDWNLLLIMVFFL